MDWGFLQALEPYAQTTQVIQQLNAAAQQHQQFQQNQDLENRKLSLQQQMEQARVSQEQTNSDRNYQLNLHNAGAIPVDSGGMTGQPATIQMPAATAPPSVPGTPQPPDVPGMGGGSLTSANSAPPPGSLSARLAGQNYAIPPTAYTQQQTDDRAVGAEVNKARQLQGVNQFHFPVPDQLADRLGVPKGAVLTLSHAPSLEEYNNTAKTENPAPSNLEMKESTNDQGNVRRDFYDPKTSKTVRTEVLPGAGKTKEAAAGGGNGGETPNSRAVTMRENLKEIDNLEKQEAPLHSMRTKLGAAIANGKLYIDEKGNAKPMSKAANGPDEEAALTDEMRSRLGDATDAVNKLIARKNDLYQQVGKPAQVSTQQAQGAVNAGSAPKQPGQQAAPKIATKAQVQAYADKNRLPYSEALKHAQQDGYQVQ